MKVFEAVQYQCPKCGCILESRYDQDSSYVILKHGIWYRVPDELCPNANKVLRVIQRSVDVDEVT